MRLAMVFLMALAALLVSWRPWASAPGVDPLDEAAGDRAVAAELAEQVEVDEAAMYSVGTGATEEVLPTFSSRGEQLVSRMAGGFLAAIHRESPKWWDCGVETPKEAQAARADRIARHVLAGMREFDAKWLSPWAVIAVIWSESRGDVCAIGPNSRKAARDLGLIPEDRIFNRWTADDVRTLLESPRWQKSRAKIGADIGMGQEIWQRYARILDPQGELRCGKQELACRIPTLSEVLSYKNGARVTITGMTYRRWMYRNTQPWENWPGSVRSLSYGMKIARLAQSMGGDVSEKPVW
jgi:hypothetical protein